MAGSMQYMSGVIVILGTWNRNVDLCCLQEVRWRGCGVRQWFYKVGGINCGDQEIKKGMVG